MNRIDILTRLFNKFGPNLILAASPCRRATLKRTYKAEVTQHKGVLRHSFFKITLFTNKILQ